MSVKVTLAKKMMALMPSRPRYIEGYFQQEYFRHPSFVTLDEDQKKIRMIGFVEADYEEATKKPFDSFFPDYPFSENLQGKSVLDIGCSLGGKSIASAESWNLKEMTGIDANDNSIKAAQLFVAGRDNKGIQYTFKQAYAEDLPFGDQTFDALISSDTIEHVQDVRKVLGECKRVLKEKGTAFIVFPSFRFPFGGAHVGSVSRTPFLEWVFDAVTLDTAYKEISSQWGDEYRWFMPESKGNSKNWAKVQGGIGVNGIMHRAFQDTIERIGFSNIRFYPTPLLSVGNTAIHYPVIRFLSNCMKPLLRIDRLVDFLSHRLVYELVT